MESGFRNHHLNEPGFSTLYVRKGRIYIGEKKINCIQIASVEALKTGQGLFKELIKRIEKYNLSIYIENACEQLGNGLPKMGFKLVSHDGFSGCWLKETNKVSPEDKVWEEKINEHTSTSS